MLDKEQKIQKLIRKIETLIYNFSHIEDCERKILQTVLREQNCEEFWNASLSLAECHVIDCIERNKNFNTTAIAQKLNITKGGVSKITAKLVKKNMIEVHRAANNHKEIYYRLKPLGRKVFEIHETLHERAEEIFKEVFRTYSQEELEAAGRFLADVTAALHSSVNLNRNISKKENLQLLDT